MSSNTLVDYRCSCGKLLLKGFLPFSIVEVKCNRCDLINSIKNQRENNGFISFSFFIDSSENIAGGCYATSSIRFPLKRFVGKHVENLFQYFRKINESHNVDFFILPEHSSQDRKISTWEEALENVGQERIKEKPKGYHIFVQADSRVIGNFN